jgi:hypothetical protein
MYFYGKKVQMCKVLFKQCRGNVLNQEYIFWQKKIKLSHLEMVVHFDKPWSDSTKQDKTVGTIWVILFFIFARCVYFI